MVAQGNEPDAIFAPGGFVPVGDGRVDPAEPGHGGPLRLSITLDVASFLVRTDEEGRTQYYIGNEKGEHQRCRRATALKIFSEYQLAALEYGSIGSRYAMMMTLAQKAGRSKKCSWTVEEARTWAKNSDTNL